MSSRPSFVAQSLDNEAPDVVVDEGVHLDPGDRERRAEFKLRMSEASDNSKVVFEGDGVTAKVARGSIFLWIQTEQRDVLDRPAPVLIWIKTGETPQTDLANATERELSGFLRDVERTVAPNSSRAMAQAIFAACDEQRQKKNYLVALGCLACLAILLGIWWAASRTG